jgi:hypothetical protein
LLERIRKYGPRKLNVFDIFYRKNGEDLELKDRIRFWVLCVKIHEDLNPMPWWYDKWFKYTPEDYMAKLFWHYDKQAKKEIE